MLSENLKGRSSTFLMLAIIQPSSEDLLFYLSGRKVKGKFVEKCKMLRAKYDTQRLYVSCRYLERLAAFTIDKPAK